MSFYQILTYCCEKLTWPFPPVITGYDTGIAMGSRVELGRPFHLIEGTHRVNYINRLYEKGLIKPEALHELILIQ